MATTEVELGPIVKTIEVARPAEAAFAVFVERIGVWWPLATHTRAQSALGQRAETVVIEPRVGGRVYERLTDGETLDWATVLAFEPGRRLTLDWRLGRPVGTQVDVRFEDLDDGRCRVHLTHAGWERLEAEGASVREGYAKGWEGVFATRFAGHASVPILFGVGESNLVWAVRIVAAERGVALTHMPSDPHAEDVRAIHPLGKIPALEHGGLRLGESLAIAAYLDRAFPGAPLEPQGVLAAARVDQIAAFAVTELDPVFIRRNLFAYLFAGDAGPDRAAAEAALPEMRACADVLAGWLEPHDWFGGAAFSRADAFLIPILAYAATTPEGQTVLAERPTLRAYLERARGRASVLATMPDGLKSPP